MKIVLDFYWFLSYNERALQRYISTEGTPERGSSGPPIPSRKEGFERQLGVFSSLRRQIRRGGAFFRKNFRSDGTWRECRASREFMAWHVFHTYATQELPLAAFLDARNIITLAPKTQEYSSKAKRIIRPFFPRYILACVDLNDGDKRDLVRKARGLRSILEYCGQPAIVPVSDVALLQSRIGPDGYIMLDEDIEEIEADGLRLGSQLKVDDPASAFDGMKGIFSKRLRGTDRSIRLQLAAFQGSVFPNSLNMTIDVCRDQVVPVLPEEFQ